MIVFAKRFPVVPLTWGSGKDQEYRSQLQNHLKVEKPPKIDPDATYSLNLEFGVWEKRLPRGMDLDNLCVNTINVFKGFLWKDDRQVAAITARRIGVKLENEQYVAVQVQPLQET